MVDNASSSGEHESVGRLSRLWSGQPEILAYFQRCADEYGLRPHLRLRTEIRSVPPSAAITSARPMDAWPRSARSFWEMTRRFKAADFSFSKAPANAMAAVESGR
jgi:hypothetical protein